jgi:hypothetical protein
MADLSKEYTNRTERTFEIPVNRLIFGCEGRRLVRKSPSRSVERQTGALFSKEQRAGVARLGN